MRLVRVMAVFGGLALAVPRVPAKEGAPAALRAQKGSADAGAADKATRDRGAGAQARPAPRAAQVLARALVSNEDWNRVLDQYANGLAGHVAQSLSARGDTVPDDLQTSIRKELGHELPYDHVVDKQAQALAKQLSPGELEQAATFYASATGKKVVEAVPQAQSELGQDLQERLASAVPQIVKRVAPRALAPDGEGGSRPPAADGPSGATPGSSRSGAAGGAGAAGATGARPPESSASGKR
jgi:hypothetical protein